MLVKTERFGEVEVAEEAMFHFPEGILGFEELKRFVLIERSKGSAIYFLQAVDDPSLAFAVTDPNSFRPDYAPQLWEEDRLALEWEGGPNLKVLTILTVPEDVRELTANLMAPVILHTEKRLGRQVVQRHGEYSTRHRVLDELERAARLVSVTAETKGRTTDAEFPVLLRESV